MISTPLLFRFLHLTLPTLLLLLLIAPEILLNNNNNNHHHHQPTTTFVGVFFVDAAIANDFSVKCHPNLPNVCIGNTVLTSPPPNFCSCEESAAAAAIAVPTTAPATTTTLAPSPTPTPKCIDGVAPNGGTCVTRPTTTTTPPPPLPPPAVDDGGPPPCEPIPPNATLSSMAWKFVDGLTEDDNNSNTPQETIEKALNGIEIFFGIHACEDGLCEVRISKKTPPNKVIERCKSCKVTTDCYIVDCSNIQTSAFGLVGGTFECISRDDPFLFPFGEEEENKEEGGNDEQEEAKGEDTTPTTTTTTTGETDSSSSSSPFLPATTIYESSATETTRSSATAASIFSSITSTTSIIGISGSLLLLLVWLV